MTACPSALMYALDAGDDVLYVLEDDSTRCGECLEDINMDFEPPHRQIFCSIPEGICGGCGKDFNNEEVPA